MPKDRPQLTDADRMNLRKLTGLDQLEKRLFRRFQIWTDQQREMFSFMIESNIEELDRWMRRRNQEKQRAENAKK